MASYNRYSHHARRALTHAGLLVSRYHHPRVDTGHLLVGVLHTAGSIGYTVLTELGLSVETAEPNLAELTLALEKPPDDIANDAALDIALELAADESSWLGHHYIGTEHLLLGITRTNVGNASDLLRELDVSPEQVRRRVRRALSDGLTEFSLQHVRRNARYTELSRRVITAAEQIALSLDHEVVGQGHLILALNQEKRGMASRLLHISGLDAGAMQQALNAREALLLNSIEPLLDQAREIAENHSSHYTGTEHLLLMLTLDEAGSRALQEFGVDTEALSEAVHEQLQDNR